METEELEALCVWLRQYAPGYHLQYKIVADLIEKQAARIIELETTIDSTAGLFDELYEMLAVWVKKAQAQAKANV